MSEIACITRHISGWRSANKKAAGITDVREVMASPKKDCLDHDLSTTSLSFTYFSKLPRAFPSRTRTKSDCHSFTSERYSCQGAGQTDKTMEDDSDAEVDLELAEMTKILNLLLEVNLCLVKAD